MKPKTKGKKMGVKVYTLDDLAKWRKRMGYSADQAATQLGCSKQSIYNWENGDEPPPRYIGLACDALALGINVIPMGTDK